MQACMQIVHAQPKHIYSCTFTPIHVHMYIHLIAQRTHLHLHLHVSRACVCACMRALTHARASIRIRNAHVRSRMHAVIPFHCIDSILPRFRYAVFPNTAQTTQSHAKCNVGWLVAFNHVRAILPQPFGILSVSQIQNSNALIPFGLCGRGGMRTIAPKPFLIAFGGTNGR